MLQIILFICAIVALIKPELVFKPKENEERETYLKRTRTIAVIIIVLFVLSLILAFIK
ncbi:MAG: hypothetical protein ACI4A3_02335 [Lachnospiraceae bacterium]